LVMQEVMIDAADRREVEARVRAPRAGEMWSIATVRDRYVYRVSNLRHLVARKERNGLVLGGCHLEVCLLLWMISCNLTVDQ
jgi:hypothetical protein